eukprot:TRINITY_DN14208_c0_g1_i1.p1 TRINITY_DN14208_c0_g1~~TRINITY_DN14208_c0_g1_i1.p1  ORF type:complete len:273 (-),score=53.41 TRINITY_DN14208_c0_g1_i1:124-942(-)
MTSGLSPAEIRQLADSAMRRYSPQQIKTLTADATARLSPEKITRYAADSLQHSPKAETDRLVSDALSRARQNIAALHYQERMDAQPVNQAVQQRLHEYRAQRDVSTGPRALIQEAQERHAKIAPEDASTLVHSALQRDTVTREGHVKSALGRAEGSPPQKLTATALGRYREARQADIPKSDTDHVLEYKQRLSRLLEDAERRYPPATRDVLYESSRLQHRPLDDAEYDRVGYRNQILQNQRYYGSSDAAEREVIRHENIWSPSKVAARNARQ